jgi:hypothetical protein
MSLQRVGEPLFAPGTTQGCVEQQNIFYIVPAQFHLSQIPLIINELICVHAFANAPI